MEHHFFAGISPENFERADRMIAMARAGRIKQHLLGDRSQTRYGTVEDRGMDDYCNFLKTKLGFEILHLKGESGHEEY